VQLAGDPSIPVFERLWLRPAVTVIGIDGHPIAGSSNQIVAEAAARVSVRVGRGQDPARLNDALRRHLERRVPLGLEVTVDALDEVPAWHTDPTGWAFDAATRALRAGFGVDPVCMGVGGTIPFVGPFADAFGGIPALLLGPADPGSRIHGEDESLHLGDWHKLIVSEVLLLAELSEHS
jgi:acetylornithine deacetylase/succinyl-diaminopimelate desuccinylase-like protein